MKRGLAGTWNNAAGTLTATLLGGPSITAYPLGYWPAPGQAAWFEEVSPGSWICHGPTSDAGYWNTSWVPTLTNLTLGNGTVATGYNRTGKTASVRVTIGFGTTTVFPGGLFTISLPTGLTGTSAAGQVIGCETFAAGTGTLWGFGYVAPSSNVIAPFAPTNTGTSAMTQIGGVGMTFGNTSSIVITGSFEVA